MVEAVDKGRVPYPAKVLGLEPSSAPKLYIHCAIVIIMYPCEAAGYAQQLA